MEKQDINLCSTQDIFWLPTKPVCVTLVAYDTENPGLCDQLESDWLAEWPIRCWIWFEDTPREQMRACKAIPAISERVDCYQELIDQADYQAD